MKPILKSLITLLLLAVSAGVTAKKSMPYTSFINVATADVAQQVNTFGTDLDGQIWYGTSSGLFAFDGFSTRHVVGACGQVYCIETQGDTLYVGSDEGVALFDVRRAEFTYLSSQPAAVRALHLCHDTLWIGAANGLYIRKLNSDVAEADSMTTLLPNQTIYAIEEINAQELLVGTFNGLYIINKCTSQIDVVQMPVRQGHSNVFVNSLFYDARLGVTWIGTEGELLNLNRAGNVVHRTSLAEGNSIKAILKDKNENLLLGTDNGLYVVDYEQHTKHVRHDVRQASSLAGNIVWSIFNDEKGNVWFGTENGISIADFDNDFIDLSDFTNYSVGNTIYAQLVDSRDRLWLGGSNGLILSDLDFTHSRWFRVGNSDAMLPHNRVRDIFEDSDHNIWIASDGGLNRYDERLKSFVRYNIVDKTGDYIANWVYDVEEDLNNNLVIATCQGGVFIVNRQQLLKSGGTYTADLVITTNNGLPNNYAERLALDPNGNIYALMHRAGVYLIDPRLRTAKVVEKAENQTVLMADSEGSLWFGGSGKLTCTTINGTQYYSAGDDETLYAIAENANGYWLSASNGLWYVDKKSRNIMQHVQSSLHRYTSIYACADGALLLGSVDGLVLTPTDKILAPKNLGPVKLTAVFVNEKPLQTTSDARYIKEINLENDQNNLLFELSDFSYTPGSQYAFRLEGFDTEWHQLRQGENRVLFPKLEPGDYTLKIGRINISGTPIVDSRVALHVEHPWFQSTWANVLYFIILASLIYGIVAFARIKHRLQIEHLEREKIKEQTQVKIDFFTNVSHEFKTPMSLVIGPLSNIILRTEDAATKTELSHVLKNARTLNQMINKALTFARVDNNVDETLNFSVIDIVEFARGIFNMHRDSHYAAGLEMSFESTVERALVNVDAVKMESSLNTLDSNAGNYTNKGSVTCHIDLNRIDNKVVIRLVDTGVGIVAEDMPHIFKKFYRSVKNRNTDDSTGIGLYLVKQYVERFSGNVRAESDGRNGTTFIITLPMVEDPSRAQACMEKIAQQHTRKLLIVEDNRQIASFIETIFADSFQCYVAHNGQAGYQTAIAEKPDIIIADIMMPIMDGMEMTRRLKKHIVAANIPVIMLTAKDDMQTEIEALQNHVEVFIAKPFEPQFLAMHVEQVLQNREKIEKQLRLENIANPNLDDNIPQSFDEKFLEKFVDLVQNNLGDSNLSMNTLGYEMAVSPKQLYRRIKTMTGQTPVEFINSMRIKRAATLLSQGTFSVSEVMYMVGHTNASYFAKCFTAIHGITPKQYLLQHQKKK